MATKRTHTPSINICLNFLCIEIETTTCHHERMEGILLQTPPSSSSLKMRNLNRSWTEKSQMNPNGPQIDSEPFFLKMRKYATQPKRYVRAHRFSLVIVWRQTHRLQNASTSDSVIHCDSTTLKGSRSVFRVIDVFFAVPGAKHIFRTSEIERWSSSKDAILIEIDCNCLVKWSNSAWDAITTMLSRSMFILFWVESIHSFHWSNKLFGWSQLYCWIRFFWAKFNRLTQTYAKFVPNCAHL